MPKLSYVLKKIKTMDYSRMRTRAKEVAKINHRSPFIIFCDMVYCGFRYQAGYEDYAYYDFANVPDKNRHTYLTRGSNNVLIHKYNDPEYSRYFDDKILFLNTFSKFIGREWMDIREHTKEEFIAFVKDRESFIVKPVDDSSGNGVRKIYPAEHNDLGELYDEFMNNRSYLVEETILQHHEMAELNPSSVNTIRLMTLKRDDGETIFVYAGIRIGKEGVIDNLGSGGMAADIDLDSGTIAIAASDRKRNFFEYHPITGAKILGKALPYWEESKALVLEAAKLIPQVRYVGWDIALRENGPLLIEGNSHPGYDILQMPAATVNHIGRKDYMEKLTGLKL